VYFNVSKDAAKYMFHRRRMGYPWKKNTDDNYLKWSIPIQNAFVKSDNLDVIDWKSVIFTNDIKILEENNINIEETNHEIHVNENNKNIKYMDREGWTVVTSKRNNVIQKHLLQTMGFLPKKKNGL
jgi:hypothetical protein